MTRRRNLERLVVMRELPAPSECRFPSRPAGSFADPSPMPATIQTAPRLALPFPLGFLRFHSESIGTVRNVDAKRAEQPGYARRALLDGPLDGRWDTTEGGASQGDRPRFQSRLSDFRASEPDIASREWAPRDGAPEINCRLISGVSGAPRNQARTTDVENPGQIVPAPNFANEFNIFGAI